MPVSADWVEVATGATENDGGEMTPMPMPMPSGGTTTDGTSDPPDQDRPTPNEQDPLPAPQRPPEPGALCTRCVDDADCAEPGARCIELFAVAANGDRQSFGERACSKDCGDVECPTGYTCLDVDEGPHQCWPDTNTCASGGGHTYGGYPRMIYIEYADGASTPEVCAGIFGEASPYECTYGTSLENCQVQLKAEIEQIFADFNISVVFEPPVRQPFYRVFVASDPPIAGWARFADCRERFVRTDAVECMYGGGRFLRAEAVGIAHEVGHTMGLDHSAVSTDLMYGTLGTLINGVDFELNADQFEDVVHPVEAGCREQQNSYRVVLDAAGPRIP